MYPYRNIIVAKVEESGGKMQDVKGWEDWQPATENSLKRDHLLSIRKSIGEFAQIIGTKDFVLAEPAEGRSFYLGDLHVLSPDNIGFCSYSRPSYPVRQYRLAETRHTSVSRKRANHP